MKILDTLIEDTINIVHAQYRKETNKNKIDEILDHAFKTLLDKISPYFILIVTLLSVLTIMNCVQFYYYIRIFLKQVANTNKAEIIKEIME